MNDSKPRLGFVGTGLMGAPMAARLIAAGYPLTVWNRSREKLAPLVASGAEEASSPAAVADAADAVLMCLADTGAVEAVVFGEHGIAAGNTGLVIDHSSIRPDATREFAARLRDETGAGWVDAPVSGGVGGARDGSLAIMAGGAGPDIDTARTVTAPLCTRFTHMGEVGAGQVTKLCNQIIVACNIVAIAEATQLARAGGVDAAKLSQALKGGFADGIVFQTVQPRMANHVYEPLLGASYTMYKDIAAASDLGGGADIALPLTGAARHALSALMDKGHGGDDICTLITVYEDGDLSPDRNP